MGRLNPYTLSMQISRMFEQGQSLFCTLKVQDWLRERNEDPNAYEIIFHPSAAPSGTKTTLNVHIELRRRDGQPTDPWLQQEVNRQA
jgi:hypothetical protein